MSTLDSRLSTLGPRVVDGTIDIGTFEAQQPSDPPPDPRRPGSSAAAVHGAVVLAPAVVPHSCPSPWLRRRFWAMGRFSLKKATRQWLRKACRIMGQREMPIGIHAVPLSVPLSVPH